MERFHSLLVTAPYKIFEIQK